MRDGVDITAQRAREFGLNGQQSNESDGSFRNRISAELREKGYIIEAHEAHCNQLYNDDDAFSPIVGIIGAVSQAMKGKDYHSRGSGQVGDDITSGVVAKGSKKIACRLKWPC